MIISAKKQQKEFFNLILTKKKLLKICDN